MQTNSEETIEYIEAEKHCDNIARQLSNQILNILKSTDFTYEKLDSISYPRQLILEKIIKFLTNQNLTKNSHHEKSNFRQCTEYTGR